MMITSKYGKAFEKKGLMRLLYLLANSMGMLFTVIKSGKLAELLSFTVWEILEKIGVYNGRYLSFDNQHPLIQFDDKGGLLLNASVPEHSTNERDVHYTLQTLTPDWAVAFVDGEGVLWGTTFSQRDRLFYSTDRGSTVEEIYQFPHAITAISVIKNGDIFVCAQGIIYKSADRGHSFRRVFEFATTNSRFRQDYTFTQDPNGNLYVGEYGLATDEKGRWRSVAWIYVSADGGDTWMKNDFFIRQGANKHIHLVKYCANMQKMIVADGDNHKRLWVNDELSHYDQRATASDKRGWRLVNRFHIQMGGHTAILEAGNEIVFGTDYLGGTNFLLRTTDLRTFHHAVLPGPYRRSMFQRLFFVLAGQEQHMWAWIDNMTIRGDDAKGLLMYSRDNGHTWTKFLECDEVQHWQRVISSSNQILDYFIITVDACAYRVEIVPPLPGGHPIRNHAVPTTENQVSAVHDS